MLDAVIDIFQDGNLNPGIDEISARSGLSNRSIYRYFSHRDELIRSAMWQAMSRIRPQMELADTGHGPLSERIERFVEHRLAMYRALAPLTRAARRAAENEPVIGEEFESGRLVLRRQFLDHFATELNRLDPGRRTRLVTAAELAFQFESFEYLHRSCRDQPTMIPGILVEQLTMYLADIG